MVRDADEMIEPVCSYISNIFDGKNKSYIYIWVSKKLKCVYIGETNEKRGTFGRARSHIGSKGTLRLRVEERLGERLETGDDFTLLTFQLPKEDKYTGIESSYRESVEYLVQKMLIESRGSYTPTFKLISNVRTFNRTQEASVNRIAEDIVDGFSKVYKSI
jgi:hypothetical protein